MFWNFISLPSLSAVFDCKPLSPVGSCFEWKTFPDENH